MRKTIMSAINKIPDYIQIGLLWFFLVCAVTLVSGFGSYLGLGETKWDVAIVLMCLLFLVSSFTAHACKEHYESKARELE